MTTGVISGDPDLEWITVSHIDLDAHSTGAIYLTGRMYSNLCNRPNTGILT
ncbi:MAG: hypothetical protein GXP45_03635 [bacterium]|nr:hypothetical protein [bacterium]